MSGFSTLHICLIAARLTKAPNDEIAADLALAALGLSEWEKAMERAADALTAELSGSGDWSRRTPSLARVALEAALTPPEARR